MSGIRIMTSAFLAISLVVTNTAIAGTSGTDANLRAELERVSQRRIFFGHQSVGVNLLEGIKQLSTISGVPVRIVETPMASDVPKATFGNAFIAKNGDPLLKLQNFEKAFGQQSSNIDIALVKFCFVDIHANTDANALFEHYRSTIDSLRIKNPGTTFVHITAPLTEVKSDLKVSLKQRLLGRVPDEIGENLRREEYNSLLRKKYQGNEPIFDLARIESTNPDGTAVTVEWNGRIAPSMAHEYTDDGGHLNTVGKLRASRELISVLAAIPANRKYPIISK